MIATINSEQFKSELRKHESDITAFIRIVTTSKEDSSMQDFITFAIDQNAPDDMQVAELKAHKVKGLKESMYLLPTSSMKRIHGITPFSNRIELSMPRFFGISIAKEVERLAEDYHFDAAICFKDKKDSFLPCRMAFMQGTKEKVTFVFLEDWIDSINQEEGHC